MPYMSYTLYNFGVQMRVTRIIISCILLAGIFQGYSLAMIYPGPAGEEVSPDFTVKVDGKETFVYRARDSAYPENQVWPGYQRPLDQTELASFCYFDTDKAVNVEIESKTKKIDQVVIRPQSKNIQPVIDGNKITFTVTQPCQLAIEVNDRHHALHLFANPVEKDPITESSENVIYFGPGVHHPGIMEVKDNQTVYVAGGAVVHTLLRVRNVKNVTIKGRGILDGTTFDRDASNIINIVNSDNVTIEGVILRDSPAWALAMFDSQNIAIDNVKIIGLWRYNADGIDIVSSNRVNVKNSFIRAFDDCIALKSYKPITAVQKNLHDIHVDNCVIWNDWGKAFEIGAETMTDEIYRCSFRNSDIIRFVHIALAISNGNRAHIHDIEYENIRIEDPITDRYFLGPPDGPEKLDPQRLETTWAPYLGRFIVVQIYEETFWSKDEKIGKVSNIRYKDIHYTSARSPQLAIIGYDAEHEISDVTFDNVTINGKKIGNVSDANIHVNDHVNGLIFK